jgi:hypothetical protein
MFFLFSNRDRLVGPGTKTAFVFWTEEKLKEKIDFQDADEITQNDSIHEQIRENFEAVEAPAEQPIGLLSGFKFGEIQSRQVSGRQSEFNRLDWGYELAQLISKV